MNDVGDQLSQLAKLHTDGALTDEEFKKLKEGDAFAIEATKTRARAKWPIIGRSFARKTVSAPVDATLRAEKMDIMFASSSLPPLAFCQRPFEFWNE
jgi:hypothetical protein